jgi:hypothetical protein
MKYYEEPGFSGSATLTGTELSPGHYNITAATNTMIVDPDFVDPNIANQSYSYLPNPLAPTPSTPPTGS